MTVLILIMVALIGLAVGSFLNVLITRTAVGESLWGRSRCTTCKKQVRSYDNIPVVSFLILRGRCRHCDACISWQYPLVELATALLVVLFLIARSVSDEAIFSTILVRNLILTPFFVLLFTYDLRFGLILDRFTFPAIVIAFLFNLVIGSPTIPSMLAGAAIIGGFFLLQYLLSRGTWIGGGDIRLGILMGVLLGWQQGLVALVIAYLLGAAVAIILLATGRASRKTPLPLGTFLVVGMFAILFFGDSILQIYL